LGDLGGLPAQRRLIALDLRDTGQSAILENAASYRCDRLVDDIVASDVDPTQRGS
jgi:proline iminopeptidase